MVAADQPAHPEAGQAVGLRHRRDADHPRREAGGDGERVAVGELAVGLVDEQPGHRVRLDDADEPEQRLGADHRPGRVVGVGDADQAGVGAEHRLDPLEVERPVVLEADRDRLDIGGEAARGLEVGRVVRLLDEDVVAGFEQRRGDDEERRSGAGGDEDLIGVDGVGVGGDLLAQGRDPAVVAVLEEQVADRRCRCRGRRATCRRTSSRRGCWRSRRSRATRGPRSRSRCGGSASAQTLSASLRGSRSRTKRGSTRRAPCQSRTRGSPSIRQP